MNYKKDWEEKIDIILYKEKLPNTIKSVEIDKIIRQEISEAEERGRKNPEPSVAGVLGFDAGYETALEEIKKRLPEEMETPKDTFAQYVEREKMSWNAYRREVLDILNNLS